MGTIINPVKIVNEYIPSIVVQGSKLLKNSFRNNIIVILIIAL